MSQTPTDSYGRSLRFLTLFWSSSLSLFHHITTSLQGQRSGGPTWILAPSPALLHGPEVVGVAEAAAVVEMFALLSPGVEEVALDQPPAGTRSLGQVARVLVLWDRETEEQLWLYVYKRENDSTMWDISLLLIQLWSDMLMSFLLS